MSLIIKDELHTQTLGLDVTHLSHAVELLHFSKKTEEFCKIISTRELEHRFSISSIIHAFSGLESVISLLGFELFFNSDSPRYIPVEKREFLLNRIIKSWDTVPCIDKISFILSHTANTTLPANTASKLRELNNLRNWLVHGFSYKKTMLLEPTVESDTYNVIDTEDSVDWKQKFPNTKFNPIGELNSKDAKTALIIVFDALKVISDSTNQPFSIWICSPDMDYKILFKDSFEEQVRNLLED